MPIRASRLDCSDGDSGPVSPARGTFRVAEFALGHGYFLPFLMHGGLSKRGRRGHVRGLPCVVTQAGDAAFLLGEAG